MSDVVGIAGNRIRSFVVRIEQIENELKDLNETKKEVLSEAKGEGFDVKILKEIIKLRKQDQGERDEHESLLDVYMRAMDEAGPAPVARRLDNVLEFPTVEGRLRRGGLFTFPHNSRLRHGPHTRRTGAAV
jgi:uncharacterized protein (UPF0335 family)